MNTKRLIMSVGMLVFVGAAVIGGTGAFFSDTETSTGNVFTAGSVSISLDSLNHTYYGDETAIPQDFFVVSTANNVPFFTFNDLKPGDTGMIEKELTNGANDAFFCAKNTLVSSDPEFLERLKLRVNTGNGLTAEQFYNAPFDEWYTLDAASAGNPGGPGLAVDANATVELDLEYCLGDFVSGTAGTPGDPGASCVVDTTSGIDWNALQNDEIRVDVEYYAVQQRNNEDFTCADLNEVETYVNTSSVLNFSDTGWGGWSCDLGDTAVGATVYEADGTTLADAGSYTGQIAGNNSAWSHYTFGSTETGYVVQNGGSAQQLVIAVECEAN